MSRWQEHCIEHPVSIAGVLSSRSRRRCTKCIAKRCGELARENARLREQLLQTVKANAELGLACVEVLTNQEAKPNGS